MADTLKTVRPVPINVNQRRGVEPVDLPNLKPHAPPPAPRMRPDEEIEIADARAEPPAAPAPARPHVTFTIHALIDDFPFDVQFSGSADQLSATVKRLRELGAIPPTPAARAAIAAEAARSAPSCSCDSCDRYGKAMKESAKAPGTYYCPGKIGMKAGQPIYCRERG